MQSGFTASEIVKQYKLYSHMAYGSVGAVSSAAPAEAGSTVDVAVADVGAVADAGAVDVSL